MGPRPKDWVTAHVEEDESGLEKEQEDDGDLDADDCNGCDLPAHNHQNRPETVTHQLDRFSDLRTFGRSLR